MPYLNRAKTFARTKSIIGVSRIMTLTGAGGAIDYIPYKQEYVLLAALPYIITQGLYARGRLKREGRFIYYA